MAGERYGYRIVSTSNAVTKKRPANYRSGVPPHQARPLPGADVKNDKRERKRLLRNDAEIAVLCLNASQGTRAHERIIAVRRGLEELRTGIQELERVSREIDGEIFPKGMSGPGKGGTRRHIELGEQYRTLLTALKQKSNTLNQVLAKYAFRPCVSYLVTTAHWRSGLIPDLSKRFFQTNVGTSLVTEADAILALVRLDVDGDLIKVKLCEMCKKRWHVAVRKIDKFCQEACRQQFYASSPDYRPRRVRIQRNFRKRVKQAEANGAGLR
jgi:hypothetical protein